MGVKILFLILTFIGAVMPVRAETSLDGERLNLEMRMQSRVEEALAKILQPGQFVVVIRVEPMEKILAQKGGNDDDEGGFFLPGVPTIKRLDPSAQAINRLTNELRPDRDVYHKFIRRIIVTLVLDQGLPDETVTRVRELTRQMLSLDPARGDALDIQRTAFQKPGGNIIIDNSGISRLQTGLKEYWVIVAISLFVFCVTVFFLFIFGPLRVFLNRLLQVLPTLKAEGGSQATFNGIDPAVLPALMAQAQALGLPAPGGPGGANFSGSLQVENPNRKTTPFSFIREDHLSNLAILLEREAPEKAAVVLGYLPTDWISRVMAKLDSKFQMEITSSLATTRQLLPEQVEDIEQDLKRRLDYLIGGPERLLAVYESLDPESQKKMFDSLRTSRPDIADELRKRIFLFEDLEKMETTALKAVLREVDLQTLVASLKGMAESFVQRMLEHLSEGKAEIVKEELDMGDPKPTKATFEAQRKIALIARRLEKDGQIQIVQVDEVPSARYGPSLRSTLKLPPGLALKESEKTPTEEGQVVQVDPKSIQERIRRFMSRGGNK